MTGRATAPAPSEYRHRWEMPMVLVAAATLGLAVVAVVVLAASDLDVPRWLSLLVSAAVFGPVVLAVMIRYTYWRAIVDAIEVREGQFPELHAVFTEQVGRAGLGYQPRLYIQNGNGVINAFAAKGRLDITKGGYVLLNSDLVDTFYELGDKRTIRFVLSHELGHLRLGHVHVRRQVLHGVLKPFLLAPTLTRAQEYSADRFAASITDRTSMRSLAVLSAGKRNYARLDLDSYIDHDAAEISRPWVAVANFRSSHAVGRRRLAAARRMDSEGWRSVHGPMF